MVDKSNSKSMVLVQLFFCISWIWTPITRSVTYWFNWFFAEDLDRLVKTRESWKMLSHKWTVVMFLSPHGSAATISRPHQANYDLHLEHDMTEFIIGGPHIKANECMRRAYSTRIYQFSARSIEPSAYKLIAVWFGLVNRSNGIGYAPRRFSLPRKIYK